MTDIPENRLSFHNKCVIMAHQVLGKKPTESLMELIALLTLEVPDGAFDAIAPRAKGLIYLMGEISEEKIQEFIDNLLAVHYNTPVGQPITVVMSSAGGDLHAGMTAISTIQHIRRSGRKVNIHVAGCAQSMASYILQAADHRSMEPTAYLMIHELQTEIPEGSTSYHINEAVFNRKLDRMLLDSWYPRTGHPSDYYLKKIKNKELYLTSAEALTEHLVDEIVSWSPYPSPPPPLRKGRKTHGTDSDLSGKEKAGAVHLPSGVGAPNNRP